MPRIPVKANRFMSSFLTGLKNRDRRVTFGPAVRRKVAPEAVPPIEEVEPLPEPPTEPVEGVETTYYVSPTGSNAAAGTEGAPWQTLQYAFDNLVSGDSLTVMNGTYTQGGTLRKSNVTIIAQSGSHIVHSTSQDIITVRDADGVTLSGIKVENALRRGFYITGSNDVSVFNCSANGCRLQGMLTSNCYNLWVEGGNYSYSVEQHGIYHSVQGDNPTFVNVTCTYNGRAGIQINSQNGATVINCSEGGIRNCTITNNGQQGAAAAINLIGVHDLIVQDTVLTGNLAGGISMMTSQSGVSARGCKRCRFINVTITGRRGLSFKSGSTDGYMDNVTMILTASACVVYDTGSLSGMELTEDYSLTPGSGHEAFRNDDSGQEYTVEEWALLA